MLSDTNLGKMYSTDELDLKSNNISSTYLNLKKNKVIEQLIKFTKQR